MDAIQQVDTWIRLMSVFAFLGAMGLVVLIWLTVAYLVTHWR